MTGSIVSILTLLLATAPSPATVGKPAPDFTAVDETGATYELAKLRGKAVVGLHGQADLRSCRNQHYPGIGPAGENICPLLKIVRRSVPVTIDHGYLLTGQCNRHRPIAVLEGKFPCRCRFSGIGRPQDNNARHGTQRRKLLNGLMRRSIFAKPDAVMRIHENRRIL